MSFDSFEFDSFEFDNFTIKETKKKMKLTTTKKSLVALGLAGALGLGTLGTNALVSQAQPDPNAVPKAENPNNRQQRQRITPEQRLKMTQDREIATIEQATGKTLTDAQKEEVRTASATRQAALQTAQDKYLEDVSKATGVEVDELKMKMRGARGRNAMNALNGQNGQNNRRGQNRQNRRTQNNNVAAPK